MKTNIISIFLLMTNCLFGEYFSQYAQDKFLNEYIFRNKKKGVFVEIGAGNGVFQSNTYFFEKCLGWSGLIIEPLPEKFENLQKVRSCHSQNVCIGNEIRLDVPFMKVSDPCSGLSGIIETFDQRDIERIDKNIQLGRVSTEIIYVDMYPLQHFLDEYEIKHIDYLSIDTEGGEFRVLQSINFNECEIDVITVENNYYKKNVSQFLLSKGYKKIARLKRDELYVRKSLLKKIKKLPKNFITDKDQNLYEKFY